MESVIKIVMYKWTVAGGVPRFHDVAIDEQLIIELHFPQQNLKFLRGSLSVLLAILAHVTYQTSAANQDFNDREEKGEKWG